MSTRTFKIQDTGLFSIVLANYIPGYNYIPGEFTCNYYNLRLPTKIFKMISRI